MITVLELSFAGYLASVHGNGFVVLELTGGCYCVYCDRVPAIEQLRMG